MDTLQTKRGLFIALEGMDGSGKSVGTAKLTGLLKAEGMNVIQTREVGGTHFGEQTRKLIFDSNNQVTPLTRLLAVLAARNQHVCEVIMPAIESGMSVVTDRFNDTTFVYQGCVDELMPAYYELSALSCLSNITRRADVTVFFEVDPQVAFTRGTARSNVDNDQYKREIDTTRKVAHGYQLVRDRLSMLQQKNFFTINGNQTLQEVEESLKQIAKFIATRYLDPK